MTKLHHRDIKYYFIAIYTFVVMINTVVRSGEIYVWQQFLYSRFVFWESIKAFFSVLSSIEASKNSKQDKTNSRAW